jgi:hypothetical protein
MGLVSYNEDIQEQIHNNRFMSGYYDKAKIERVVSIVSPPLQPCDLPIGRAVSPEPDTAAAARRAHELRDLHTLALLELRPGRRWRN